MKKVYMADGALAHVVVNYTDRNALCGRTPWPGHWLGGGGLTQREQVAKMPICAACREAIRRRR